VPRNTLEPGHTGRNFLIWLLVFVAVALVVFVLWRISPTNDTPCGKPQFAQTDVCRNPQNYSFRSP